MGSCKYCNKYTGGEGIILSSLVAISFPRQILLHVASSIFIFFLHFFCYFCFQGAGIGTRTRLRVGKPRNHGSISGTGKIIFLKRRDLLWGPPNLVFNGKTELFPSAMKRPECETDHPTPSSVEVKNEYS